MEKLSKQFLAFLMAVLMIPVFYALPAKAYDNRIYLQDASRLNDASGFVDVWWNGNCYQSKWEDHRYYYDKKWQTSNSFKESACGIFAFVNAVSFLNGSYIDPDELATYATNHDYHSYDGTSHALYKTFCDERGSQYGIAFDETCSWSSWNSDVYVTLRNKLQNGCTAISYTSKHILAIVAYNASNDTYMIVDSSPASWRGTDNNGYAWKTWQELRGLLYWNAKKGYGANFYFIRSTYPKINGEFFIRSSVTNDADKMLDVYYGGDSSKYAKNAQIYHFNGGNNQKFRVNYIGNGWHRIESVASGKVLDVEGGTTNVIVWGRNDNDNQCWRFIPDGDGFRIQSKLGGYLDVEWAGTGDETNVQIYDGNGTAAQRWGLYYTK